MYHQFWPVKVKIPANWLEFLINEPKVNELDKLKTFGNYCNVGNELELDCDSKKIKMF